MCFEKDLKWNGLTLESFHVCMHAPASPNMSLSRRTFPSISNSIAHFCVQMEKIWNNIRGSDQSLLIILIQEKNAYVRIQACLRTDLSINYDSVNRWSGPQPLIQWLVLFEKLKGELGWLPLKGVKAKKSIITAKCLLHVHVTCMRISFSCSCGALEASA